MSASPSVDMLPFGVTIPATVPQRSEIPEKLTNYSLYERKEGKGEKIEDRNEEREKLDLRNGRI